MRLPQKIRRAFEALVLVALLLGLAHGLGLGALKRRTEGLDERLGALSKGLAELTAHGLIEGSTIEEIVASAEKMRPILATNELAEGSIRRRLDFNGAVEAGIKGPFQLVKFQKGRLEQRQSLNEMAKSGGVHLAPPVLEALPEYDGELARPEWLWLQLGFAHQLLATAILSGVEAVESFKAQSPETLEVQDLNQAPLIAIPFIIELKGPTPDLYRFMSSLPLLPQEINADGQSACLPDKPPLFIDRILIRKQNPEKVDQAHLALRVIGYYMPPEKPD